MLNVVDDVDDIVSVAENTALFEQKIRDEGGLSKLYISPQWDTILIAFKILSLPLILLYRLNL